MITFYHYYHSQLGTGLSNMKFHKTTKTNYCTTCKSHKCYKIAYIPKYDYIWTWEQQYKVTQL